MARQRHHGPDPASVGRTRERADTVDTQVGLTPLAHRTTQTRPTGQVQTDRSVENMLAPAKIDLMSSPHNHPAHPAPSSSDAPQVAGADATRDIAEVPAVEVITTTAVHLMSAAAVKCGLAADEGGQPGTELADLDEARKLIVALAGLVTASAPDLGNEHARALRDGLRSLQLAFREASAFPDPIGQGPGEDLTGPVT